MKLIVTSPCYNWLSVSNFLSDQGPDTGEFELVVDGIQGLRQLIEKFADKEDDEDQQDMVSNSEEHKSFIF